MNCLHCRIITPKGCVFEKDAAYISVPSIRGTLGILPNRLPIIAALNPSGGILKVTALENDEGVEYFFVIKGGTLTHKKNGTIILADSLIAVESSEEGLELIAKK